MPGLPRPLLSPSLEASHRRPSCRVDFTVPAETPSIGTHHTTDTRQNGNRLGRPTQKRYGVAVVGVTVQGCEVGRGGQHEVLGGFVEAWRSVRGRLLAAIARPTPSSFWYEAAVSKLR